MSWVSICAMDDIPEYTGVAALVEGHQVAIFKVGGELYAIDNYDPIGGANVLSRGIVGSLKGELVVASPLYKQHFSLLTGNCLEDAEMGVKPYTVRSANGMVELDSSGLKRQAA